MVKKLLFIGLMLAAFLGFTQIPNAGFETVTLGKPNNYNLGSVYSFFPIRDTLSPAFGIHAAAIYGSVPPAYNGAVISEHAMIGMLPTGLSGWYKYKPELGDSLIFDIGVYKQGFFSTAATNNYTSTILTGTTSVYTQFNVPINYTGYGFMNCDSAYIIIYPTGNVSALGFNWAHPNTVAVFDDLAWTYTVLGVPEIDKILAINLENVSPNPANNYANIIYTVSEPTNISLKLYDITGKEVLRVIDNEHQNKGRYKAEAELTGLQSGVYLYEFTTSSGYKVTKKLIKQ